MKCPNCGKTMEDIIFMDFEEYDGKVYASYEAHCHSCNRDWHWEDVYEYTETTIPHLIRINDHL
jgi:predicted RNA-binding Zn-ribbon protein involved in translation (DUF1610 family)